MKYRTGFISAVIFTFALGAAPSRGADVFVYGFEDLPLMAGLSQVVGNSILFDTPQGRIVQASAVGKVSQSAVLQFYSETLPQLGWTIVDETEFHREGETLRVEFTTQDQKLEVRFLVEPTAN
ncbi:MAG: hypothetical protein HN793_03415 [Rhodospirillaceae bacterium]|jgi:hypothetical protein|nr:hypothetical protein [Rhodospirillaceae bacterium]MBT5240504.1 hypothetical protein [Rhodospirillaceae bacterium]MBT5564931.1 hypothetical protein [Rhodospirillaceae bacterium]MBT6090527.1 hypothetical protein [Rhodospirillaceae bacterium]MBT7449852.1 hypothetical protein [Rhodospirillaceae bacterium]